MVIWPGRCFAWAIKSAKVRIGELGETTRTWLVRVAPAMGVRSRRGSYGRFFTKATLAASGESEAHISVRPSGLARTTSIVPISPAPPDRLSMTIDWPSNGDSAAEITRVAESFELPAGS